MAGLRALRDAVEHFPKDRGGKPEDSSNHLELQKREWNVVSIQFCRANKSWRRSSTPEKATAPIPRTCSTSLFDT